MELRPSSLVFKVHRQTSELIAPVRPTPREIKLLSDIDDQETLRNPIRVIYFFRRNPSSNATEKDSENTDNVKLVRKALAETLVHYYPVAGRLREGPDRKLMVECTGEGVPFVEADADVALDELEDALHPPFPCFEELHFDVERSDRAPSSPTLAVQVTRLKCGGFIVALSFPHAMFDATGIAQFMNSMGELARGADAPSVPPIWDRHFLSAKVPARVTHVHREYDEVVVADINETVPHGRTVQRSFFFGPPEISMLSGLIPAHLRGRTTHFELLASFLWRCRTIAMKPYLKAKARLIFPVNIRKLFYDPQKYPGYYGNAFVLPTALAAVEKLTKRPLEYALRRVQEAKASVTYEYVTSTMDLMATRGRPPLFAAGTYLVSDTRCNGFDNADFGWGPPVYCGPADSHVGDFDRASFLIKYKKKNGETGIMFPIILPEPAMERFGQELGRVFDYKATSIRSSL